MAFVRAGRTGSAGVSGQAGWGLTALRVLIGIFFVFEGLGKSGWLANAGPLANQLNGWLQTANNPYSRWYLEAVAIPGAVAFARLVMLGELAAGIALVLGMWTRVAAALALLMVLNFHFASGAMFKYQFLTNGYGLPVIGGLLALAIGGARLPWSLRG